MSHYIPVFFFPLKKSDIPNELSGWKNALPLLAPRLENPRNFDLRQSVSRNWWHQHALDLLGKGLQIAGLEFITSEIACLCGDELRAASKALDELMIRIADGIPNLGPFEHTDIEHLRIPEHRRAIQEAKAAHEIDVKADFGYEATVGFYSFVKSLQATIQEAIAEEQCLLYVRIQP